MYLLAKAALGVLLLPGELVAMPLNLFLGLSWVSENPELYTRIAPHGGVVASSSPLHLLFSSIGIANTFLPLREYFAYILPVQVTISTAMIFLAIVRVILRFVPGITAG